MDNKAKELAAEIWTYLNDMYDIDVDIEDIENIVESNSNFMEEFDCNE